MGKRRHISNVAAIPTKPHGRQTASVTRTVTAKVALDGSYQDHVLKIIYTNESSIADTFMREHVTSESDIGFDLEHKPCYVAGSKPNISLMQLAPNTAGIIHPVLLFSLYHNSGQLPRSVQDAIHNSTIKKHGIGIKTDMQYLAYLGLSESSKASFTELGPLAFSRGVMPRPNVGLKALVTACMGEECATYKSKKLAMTNWERKDLDEKQLRYAAMDAFTGIELYRILSEKPIVSQKEQAVLHTDHEQPSATMSSHA